jgi:hypothetical protein
MEILNAKEEFIFKKIDGTIIGDVAVYIKDYLTINKDKEYSIAIGTDSQRSRKGRKLAFVTAICLREIGHGGHIISSLTKPYNSKIDDRFRLWQEVECTMAVANYLRDEGVFELFRNVVEFHVDCNPKDSEFSNAIYAPAQGYVNSMGFRFVSKPDAYAASTVADKIVKNK